MAKKKEITVDTKIQVVANLGTDLHRRLKAIADLPTEDRSLREMAKRMIEKGVTQYELEQKAAL